MNHAINAYFQSLIQQAGGPKAFANQYGLSAPTIEAWAAGTRRAQENSLTVVACALGLGTSGWTKPC